MKTRFKTAPRKRPGSMPMMTPAAMATVRVDPPSVARNAFPLRVNWAAKRAMMAMPSRKLMWFSRDGGSIRHSIPFPRASPKIFRAPAAPFPSIGLPALPSKTEAGPLDPPSTPSCLTRDLGDPNQLDAPPRLRSPTSGPLSNPLAWDRIHPP